MLKFKVTGQNVSFSAESESEIGKASSAYVEDLNWKL